MKSKVEAACIMGNLVQAVEMLQKCSEFSLLMPEVRVNIVFALPGAKNGEEVAAVDGRITVVNGYPRAAGLPVWGGSDHMARLIIEMRKYDRTVNAGINFKCDSRIIDVVKRYAEEKGIRFGWIDRTKEPESVSSLDGSSMPWKIKYLVDNSGGAPKLFYEGDGWGKEPLFVALGDSAVGVAKTAIEIARRYKKSISA